jgi:hypothetical protein
MCSILRECACFFGGGGGGEGVEKESHNFPIH